MDTFNAMPPLAPMLQELSSAPAAITEEHITEIERFVVIMYKRTSPHSSVTELEKL